MAAIPIRTTEAVFGRISRVLGLLGGAAVMGTLRGSEKVGPVWMGLVLVLQNTQGSPVGGGEEQTLTELDVATLGIQTTPADKCKRQPFTTHQPDSSEVATPFTTPNAYQPATVQQNNGTR